jgi:CxxC motif-containing protein (DUF1111 family)
MFSTIKSRNLAVALCAAMMSAAGCGGTMDDDAVTSEVGRAEEALAGNHLNGISDAEFNTVQANFVAAEATADGLGPIFNQNSCGGCHNLGAVGGAGTAIERRFGRFDSGIFNPLANKGGSLRQLQTLGAWKAGCNVPVEVEPSEATVHNVGRLTTPLFGLGLVDALPDSTFRDLAAAEPVAVRGTVNVVTVILPPGPADPTQSVGSQRVGRFGWKAGVPNLVQFAADAYVNEMGITTQHCSNGTSVTAFSTESAPNGVPVTPTCEDGKPGIDDAVGSCSGGRTEIQEDVANFTTFMTFLSPPGRAKAAADDADLDGNDNDPTTPPGRKVFDRVGCNGCHYRKAMFTPASPFNGVPGGKKFHPFSDFLVHDMGTLGDHIGNAGDSEAVTRRMRTAPLWGLRFRSLLLHDGRSTDVPSAIAQHNGGPLGQGTAAATAFANLPAADRASLLDFLGTL